MPPRSTNALVHAHAGVVSHTCDFVFDEQFATLQLGNLQIIDRRMLERLGEFVLKRLVPSFELCKMRLNSHGKGLLVRFGLTTKLCHAEPTKSTDSHCAAQQIGGFVTRTPPVA